MKEFKINKKGFFVCEECEKPFYSIKGLSSHIRMHNLSKQEYFDKWLKDETDGKCKICQVYTPFKSLSTGYKNTCCAKHTMKIHYGVENQFQREECKEQAKKTMMKNHGVEHALQSSVIKEEMKANLLKKYGVDHNFKIEKVKIDRIKTWNKNLGVGNPSQSDKIKKQKEETCLKNYGFKAGFCDTEKCIKTFYNKHGCDFPSQNPESFEKGQLSGKRIKYFKETGLYYRGTYELDFLNIFYDNFSDMQQGKTIPYKLNGKNHKYHSDFYIPSLNLIIEIKNSYLFKRDKSIINAKEKATIANGFKYVMILDKNYSIFLTNYGN